MSQPTKPWSIGEFQLEIWNNENPLNHSNHNLFVPKVIPTCKAFIKSTLTYQPLELGSSLPGTTLSQIKKMIVTITVQIVGIQTGFMVMTCTAKIVQWVEFLNTICKVSC